jgi:hypothetical protein
MKLKQLKKVQDERAKDRDKSNSVFKHARTGLNKAKKYKDRKKAERNPRKNTKHKKAFESVKST